MEMSMFDVLLLITISIWTLKARIYVITEHVKPIGIYFKER